MGVYAYVRSNTPGRADSSGLGQDVGDEMPLSSLPDRNPADPQDCYVVGGPRANPELLERGSCAIGTGWQWKNQPGCNYCCRQHALCTACLVGGDAQRWSSQGRRRQGCRFKSVPGMTPPIGLEVPVPLSYDPDPPGPYCGTCQCRRVALPHPGAGAASMRARVSQAAASSARPCRSAISASSAAVWCARARAAPVISASGSPSADHVSCSRSAAS